MSVPSGFHRPEPDEDFAEEYTERMMSAQMRQLDPLKEDLAEWLNKNLGECRSDLVFFFNSNAVRFRCGALHPTADWVRGKKGNELEFCFGW